MGRISEYEQGRLASSVVGTPGVDTSASKFFNTVASTAGQLESTVSQIGQQNYIQAQRELYAKQKEQQRLERIQQKAANQAASGAIWLEASLALDKNSEDIKNEYADDPDAGLKEIQKRDKETIQAFTENISNPEVKANILNRAINSTTGRMSGMTQWAYAQRTNNIQENLVRSENALITKAGNAQNFQEFQGVLEEAKNLEPIARNVYDAEKSGKFSQELNNKLAKQYMSGVFARDPAMVKPTLDSGAFDTILNADDRLSLQKKFMDYANAQKRLAEKEVKTQVAETKTNVQFSAYDIRADKSMTLPEKQKLYEQMREDAKTLPKKEQLQTLKDIDQWEKQDIEEVEKEQKQSEAEIKKQKTEALKSPEAQEARYQINRFVQKYNLNDISKDGITATEFHNVKVYRDKIEQAHKSGQIDDKTYERERDKSRAIMETYTEANKTKQKPTGGFFGMFQTGPSNHNVGTSSMFQWEKDLQKRGYKPEKTKGMVNRAVSEFDRLYFDFKREKNKEPSPQQLQKMIDMAKRNASVTGKK